MNAFNIQNSLEYDEYSIFIISASGKTFFVHAHHLTFKSSEEQTSRLWNPTEYLFDILSECVRSKMVDYHLIVKRMLWFTTPIIFDDNNTSDVFIDFMYHQLVPELLEGIMIVIKDNQFSDEMMVERSLIEMMKMVFYFRGNSHCSLLCSIGLRIKLVCHPCRKRLIESVGYVSEFCRREVKHLLPATALKLKSVRPQIWTNTVHEKLYSSVEPMTVTEAKIKFLSNYHSFFLFKNRIIYLGIVQTWPLFGTSFFAVQVFSGYLIDEFD